MDWVELLDVVVVLHCSGMSLPMALEQHAYYGSGPSQLLAQEWVAQRQVGGEPVAAMRALAVHVHGDTDRFVQETLTICLEDPGGDHGKVLTTAVDQFVLQGDAYRVPRVWGLIMPALLGAGLIEVLRFMIAGLER